MYVSENFIRQTGFMISQWFTGIGTIEVPLDASLVDCESLFIGDDELQSGEFLESWTKGFDNLAAERFIAVLAGNDREERFARRR